MILYQQGQAGCGGPGPRFWCAVEARLVWKRLPDLSSLHRDLNKPKTQVYNLILYYYYYFLTFHKTKSPFNSHFSQKYFELAL